MTSGKSEKMSIFSEFGKISVAANTNRAIELELVDEQFEQMDDKIIIHNFHLEKTVDQYNVVVID